MGIEHIYGLGNIDNTGCGLGRHRLVIWETQVGGYMCCLLDGTVNADEKEEIDEQVHILRHL